jgi:ATP-dependent helicase/nuclease subunit A
LPFTLRLTSDDLVGLEKVLPEALPPSEFVVVQGQVDLALFLEEGIWLLDFKTDLITEQQLPEKVGHYAPQLKLYGLALNRIYHRPVTERWLHFLSLGRTVAA